MARTGQDFHDRLELLSGLELFRGLSRAKLLALAGAVVPMRFDAGAMIVRRHADAEYLYVVVDGEVDVIRPRRAPVRLGAGKHFGELAVVSGTPHEADAVAHTPTTVYALERAAFLA
jgi:CRP/FNR family transcriptional regulator, cyclic AMP receptor protein